MAYLKPDRIDTVRVGRDSLTIKVKITPDGATATKHICSYIRKGDLVKPNRKLGNGDGIVRGITVHNTDSIATAQGTNPAEQYARATYPNGNMNGVAVHFWVWRDEIWQQLREDEQGWHASDGATRRASHRAGETIGGNLDTISIECIETGTDKQSEDTTAKLVAYLLDKHGLSPETDVYTHQYFLPGKRCPAYILPHWETFAAAVKRYFHAIREGDVNGDGKVNGKDATVLMRHLAGWGNEIDETAADMDGDGKVNGKDATLLLRKLAGWGNGQNGENDGTDTPSIDLSSLPVLRYGSTGDMVQYLQTRLISLGYSCGASGADGSFGPATLAAVKRFQRERGLVVDGSVGPRTWRELVGK